MNADEEYRRQAADCRRMAENAISADNKQAWLRLATLGFKCWLSPNLRIGRSRATKIQKHPID
jgi:hypothetical protein